MQTWEQVKDRRFGDTWQPYELEQSFEAIAGGVACPGKQPGHAIIAGLRPVRQKDIYEIHVLDEVQSPDLWELLSRCHSMIPKYRISRMEDDSFRWYGDGLNSAMQAIAQKVNEEGRPLGVRRPESGELRIITSSRLLNMGERALPFILTELRRYLMDDRRELHLHGAKVAHTLHNIRQDEIADLRFGDQPSIEALAYAVLELRDTAAQLFAARFNPPKEQGPYDPMAFV
jgi:hypothetical protein